MLLKSQKAKEDLSYYESLRSTIEREIKDFVVFFKTAESNHIDIAHDGIKGLIDNKQALNALFMAFSRVIEKIELHHTNADKILFIGKNLPYECQMDIDEFFVNIVTTRNIDKRNLFTKALTNSLDLQKKIDYFIQDCIEENKLVLSHIDADLDDLELEPWCAFFKALVNDNNTNISEVSRYICYNKYLDALVCTPNFMDAFSEYQSMITQFLNNVRKSDPHYFKMLYLEAVRYLRPITGQYLSVKDFCKAEYKCSIEYPRYYYGVPYDIYWTKTSLPKEIQYHFQSLAAFKSSYLSSQLSPSEIKIVESIFNNSYFKPLFDSFSKEYEPIQAVSDYLETLPIEEITNAEVQKIPIYSFVGKQDASNINDLFDKSWFPEDFMNLEKDFFCFCVNEKQILINNGENFRNFVDEISQLGWINNDNDTKLKFTQILTGRKCYGVLKDMVIWNDEQNIRYLYWIGTYFCPDTTQKQSKIRKFFRLPQGREIPETTSRDIKNVKSRKDLEGLIMKYFPDLHKEFWGN